MPIQWIRTHQKPLRTIIIEEEEAHEGHDLKNLEELIKVITQNIKQEKERSKIQGWKFESNDSLHL